MSQIVEKERAPTPPEEVVPVSAPAPLIAPVVPVIPVQEPEVPEEDVNSTLIEVTDNLL